jgi:hypothetical protein
MLVTPAKAGVHNHQKGLDSGFRRNDGPSRFQIIYTTIKLNQPILSINFRLHPPLFFVPFNGFSQTDFRIHLGMKT